MSICCAFERYFITTALYTQANDCDLAMSIHSTGHGSTTTSLPSVTVLNLLYFPLGLKQSGFGYSFSEHGHGTITKLLTPLPNWHLNGHFT